MHPATSPSAGARPRATTVPLDGGCSRPGRWPSPSRCSSAPRPAATTTTPADPNDPVELSIFWWGGEARAKLDREGARRSTRRSTRTSRSRRPGRPTRATSTSWPRSPPAATRRTSSRSTTTAWPSTPSRNVTLDLTTYAGDGKIDVTKFPESLSKYGVVDGKLVGVADRREHPGP